MPSSFLHFICPHCSFRGVLLPDWAGKEALCIECGKTFNAPILENPTTSDTSPQQPSASTQPSTQHGGYPTGYTPNPVVEAMVAAHGSTQSPSQGTPVIPSGQRCYFDCPNCGKSYYVDEVDPNLRIDCSACNGWFLAEDGLNWRTTPKPVEEHGFFKRLWSGSSISKTNREKLESRARQIQAIVRLEELNGNYQSAQLWQLRLNEINRQIREL